MDDFTNLTQAQTALADPATSAEQLMAIAQAQPTLWADVARHPNAYSGLLDWLNANGDETVRAAVAIRRTPTPPPPPAETPSPKPAAEESSIPDEETSATESTEEVSEIAQAEASSGPPSDVEEAPVATAEETPVVEESQPEPDAELLPADSPFTSEAPTTLNKPTAPKLTPKLKKILIAAGSALVVIVVAVLLVVNLIIAPKQEAAAEQARIEQEHQAAVDAFTDAAAFCNSATQSLASQISAVQARLKTDPATMNDPTLIDALKTAITTAQALPPCTVPTMGEDTAIITQQTKDLTSTAAAITAGSSKVGTAASNVTASVLAKKSAEQAATSSPSTSPTPVSSPSPTPSSSPSASPIPKANDSRVGDILVVGTWRVTSSRTGNISEGSAVIFTDTHVLPLGGFWGYRNGDGPDGVPWSIGSKDSAGFYTLSLNVSPGILNPKVLLLKPIKGQKVEVYSSTNLRDYLFVMEK